MASIEDIAVAAHRIGQSANGVQQRTQGCADTLRTHHVQLAALVKGSATGIEAARQVQDAERAVRDCAAKLLTLQSTIDRFIRDLTK